MALNENKSGDSSLRDWFGKSKSSDGKPGWVQLGGKYAGKPCAKQPGQTTKPKCGSSKMKRALSKDEEEAAFRRKNRQDPNPDRKGKAINVKTEGVSTDIEVPSKNLKALAAKAVKRIDADVDGDVDTSDPKTQEMGEFVPSADGKKKVKTKVQRESMKLKTVQELLDEGDFWNPDADKDRTMGGPGANRRAREDGGTSKPAKKPDYSNKLKPGESYIQFAKRKKAEKMKEEVSMAIDKRKHRSAQRDAKIGNLARNTDNPGEKAAAEKKAKGPKLIGEKCWKGYEKKGMKTMFGKRYPNCVKKEENELDEKCWDGYTQKGLKKKGNRMVPNCVPVGEQNIEERSLSKAEEKDKEKYVKGMKKSAKDFKARYGDDYKSVMYATATNMAKEEVVDEAAAWTRKAGKNKSGGLNEKGRKSYERENPGSDLKAPSKKVGNPRRASFCARMKGMKKKLTSSKTANDPDSRINKSLRAWNC